MGCMNPDKKKQRMLDNNAGGGSVNVVLTVGGKK